MDSKVEWIEWKVTAIRPETADCKTYVLKPVDGLPVPYQAGQFLTLLLQHEGHELRRSYSISSTPEVDTSFSLTIKRVVNGEVSRWLLQNLQVGDTLRSLPPAGRFTLDSQADTDLFLVAAGSGITPIYSLIKAALYQQPQRRIVLFYSNTSRSSTIFKDELDALTQQFPERLTIEYLYSNPPADERARRLNNTLFEKLLARHLDPTRNQPAFYLCGPEDFMRLVRIVLLFLGFPAESIRKENFVIPPQTPAIPEGFGLASQVEIEYRNQRYTLEVPAGTYLLTAALKSGISLPYSCRGGRCSTCVAQCLEGRVKMTINDVLTERELAQGEILTCTALAETSRILIKVG
ncbi:oxidoreductase [Siphonobacter sp. BAB-5385]|uniref:ferredoxin--NADP reductase n=1 Tax=Siphonobacter sp. BAB-5385 TaxID=1864822 RepID=UPI000B9E5D97|nr:ferredoxin--NADP reductase [Siphonobacter sp. BAB-5385]OZI06248.1 oxidoreductase [Siphonobacter sp. BAB-5385]